MTAKKAFGLLMKNVQELAKRLGRNHELAAHSGTPAGTKARMLTARSSTSPIARHSRANGPLVPGLRQLGHLRHPVLSPVRPHAARLGQGQVARVQGREEFVKRAAFALLAISPALHDKALGAEARFSGA